MADKPININAHAARVAAQKAPNPVTVVSFETEAQSLPAGEFVNVENVTFVACYNTSGSAAVASAKAAPGGTSAALLDAQGAAVSVSDASVQPILVAGVKYLSFDQTVTIVMAG